MNTIFDNFSKDIDLSIFKKSNEDPKTPLRRRYLSLVGLLEYVDIFNGDLTDRSLPEGMTADDVKRMVSHSIGDLDTKQAMAQGTQGTQGTDSGDDSGETKHHDYVDLGLDSGTLWATTNIQDADGNNLYFAWGETRGYEADMTQTPPIPVGKDFIKSDYELAEDSGEIMSRYNDKDNEHELLPDDDAATQLWGSDWRMPSKEQFEELIEGTTQKWTQVGDITGMLLTSKVNGNEVFFPAIGECQYNEIPNFGSYGVYWTRSLQYDNSSASSQCFGFGEEKCTVSNDPRFTGLPVRPVRSTNQ